MSNEAHRKVRLFSEDKEMAYSVTRDLTFCLIDAHPIFLDIDKDRYFKLPPDTEMAFIKKQYPSALVREIHIQTPMRSALERVALNVSPGLAVVLEVTALVLSVSLELKWGKLKRITEALARWQRKNATAATSEHLNEEIELLRACAFFRRARMAIPISTRCLLDSIALIRFMARRNLCGDLVFGVTADPFTAHCWVQCGDMVMNDTLGNTQTYTPIRVI
jgi:hypothetical protein